MSSSAITGPIFTDVRRSPSGSAAAPSWSFNDSQGTGFYLVSADVLGLSTAGVQRVVVTAAGNVGIGTASPGVKLDVRGNATFTGNATARQTVDFTNTGGQLYAGVESSAGGAVFTGSSAYAGIVGTNNSTALQLATNGAVRATLDASGNLLVGTTDAAFNSGSGFKMGVGSNPVLGVVGASSSNGDITYRLYSTGAAAYRFYVGMGGTVYATSTTISGISDQRLKENVRELDDGLASVMALKPRKFDWKPGKGKDIKDDRGFIAQEFEQVFPDMIDTWQDPAPEGEEPYKSVNANLIPTLVKAIQELSAKNDALEARLAALESK